MKFHVTHVGIFIVAFLATFCGKDRDEPTAQVPEPETSFVGEPAVNGSTVRFGLQSDQADSRFEVQVITNGQSSPWMPANCPEGLTDGGRSSCHIVPVQPGKSYGLRARAIHAGITDASPTERYLADTALLPAPQSQMPYPITRITNRGQIGSLVRQNSVTLQFNTEGLPATNQAVRYECRVEIRDGSSYVQQDSQFRPCGSYNGENALTLNSLATGQSVVVYVRGVVPGASAPAQEDMIYFGVDLQDTAAPVPPAPIPALINSLPNPILLANYQFLVPQDMHITELATNKTDGNYVDYFQILKGTEPGMDPNYRNFDGNTCGGGLPGLSGAVVMGQSPDGSWFNYCKRTPGWNDYKVMTQGRAFNRIEVTSNPNQPELRKLQLNVFDGQGSQMEFALNRDSSAWLRLCEASPERALFLVDAMPQLFSWGAAGAAPVLMMVCRTTASFGDLTVAGFMYVAGGYPTGNWQVQQQVGGRVIRTMPNQFVTEYVQTQLFCEVCTYPRAAEIVYTKAGGPFGFLPSVAMQLQQEVLSYLNVRY